MSKDSLSRTGQEPLVASSDNPKNRSPKNIKVISAIGLVLGIACLFFLAQFFGVMIVFTFLQIAGIDSDRIQELFSDNVWVQFVGIFTIQSIVLLFLYAYHRYKKIGFLNAVGLKKRPNGMSVLWAVGGYFLYFISFVATATVVRLVLPGLDIEQAQQLGFESPEGLQLVAVFVSLVVLPSIAEEIVFRGFLFQRLRALINFKLAILITSILFAILHLEFFADGPLNWIAALDTFVFSLFLIFVYVKSGSLWASIFLHAIKNSIAYTLLFII